MSRAIIEAVIGGAIALVVGFTVLLSLSPTINQQSATAAANSTAYGFSTATVMYNLLPLIYAVVPLLFGVGVGFVIYKSRS